MKNIVAIMLFLVTFAFSADVKPFAFTNIDADSQQVEWDILMKYKMFGQTGIEFMGQKIVIPDKSGWFGTATGNWSLENNKHHVGGPILIGGNVSFKDGEDTLSTGPVRVLGNITTTNFNPTNIINGTQCIQGSVSDKYLNNVDVENRYVGANYSSCPSEIPEVRTELTIPVAEQVADSNKLSAQVVGNSGTIYIDIPPTDGKEMYDLYIPYLQFNNGGHLYFRMQNGGRLTRVFLKDGIHNFIAGNSIQVIYMDTTAEYVDGHWSGEGSVINNTDYSGNLLFYTTRDITWPAMNPGDTIQGTFITTGTIYVRQHMVLAGQLLANYIKVDADFDGRGFLYVPFDPPVLNIDPTALASGKFQENNKDVIIPIHLDTLAKTDVYFKYCFILNDAVTQDDFNVAVPACGSDTGSVFIPAGDSLPQTNIYLNVKVDGISEGDETLKFHIFDLQGAVMPGNVHSGNFNLTLTDAGAFGLDTTWHYTEFENYEGTVDYIRVIGKSDSTRFYIDSAFTDRYELDSITGQLTILDSIDYETTQFDTIKVRLTDTNGVVVVDYISIAVTDINEAPVVNDTTISVPENSSTGTVVGTVIAKDPDILNSAFSTLTYTILDNTVPFKIDNTGKVTATDGSKLNHEVNPSYTFKVVVSDGTLSDTAMVTVNVTDVKENPHFIDDGNKNYNVNENEVTGYEIAVIKLVDDDGFTGMTHEIKNNTGADSLFKYLYLVKGDTIELHISVEDQTKLDYEKINPVHELTIIVTDGDGLKDSIVKTVTVIDVNEAPVLNDTTLVLNENIPIPSIVGKLTAIDEDKTSAFRQNVFAIIDGNSNFSIDPASGRITATKIFNYESDDSVYTLKVKVSDKNNPALSDTATVTIKIGNTNEGPKFATEDTTFFVNENTAPGIVGSIPAIDEDGDKITYTIVGNVPFVVDTVGNVKSTKEFDYETETGFSFKVVATDGTMTDTVKVNVKVNNVNEECTVNDTTFSINENTTGKVGNVNASDKDKDALFGTITYTISDPVNYQVDIAGNVFVKTEMNYEDNKFDTVQVYITDGTFKDTATVIIEVLNVPEDIVLTTTVNRVDENVEINTPVAVVTGVDGDSTKVTYTINTTDFKIDPITGVITTNSNIDYETQDEYVVTVTATSTDGSKKDTVITILVNDVNEPLTVNDTMFTVKEGDTGIIGKVVGEDLDGDTIKYTLADSDANLYRIDGDGTITLKEKFDYETTQYDTLTVYATDDKGIYSTYDTVQIIIKVENVNEPPVLQPNDTLKVKENCDTCTVGKITAIDPDIGDKVIYEVVEPGFEIDSTGILTITKPVDYETTPEIVITVIAKDTTGASDTLEYKIKIDDVNEPVHVDDKTCVVKENYVGDVCQIPAKDDDGLPPTYSVTDTTNYSIDSTGTLVIKNPIDFEQKQTDTVTVIVTDGVFYDTAKVVIKVEDVPENTQITEVDDMPKQDTIKTNDPDHKIEWKICEDKKCVTDSLEVEVHKDTTIKVCNEKKTSCDEVVILFNDTPPVVTLTNAKSTDALIDYITIEEQKDDKIYVNKKENPITVIVQDTVRKTEQRFDITVKLDTLPTKNIKLEDYKFVIDEFHAEVKPIGDNRAELVQVIDDHGIKVTITQIVNLTTKEPIDSVQTVSYTKTAGGKDVTVTYTADNITGQRIGDYNVSYMIDSCTSVSYAVNDKQKIVKNDEGNIGYVITYDYVDDFGNKATASVKIVYDDIPPTVEILTPTKNDVFKTNAVEVKWTVNGEVQDTLTLQRLEKGANAIVRRYVDKAGNVACDTVVVIMKEAKDIDVRIIHPVTEVDQEKVDQYYSEGNKYNPEKPFVVKVADPKSDSLPETIGVGFKIDIALPSVSATGGLATLDDIVKNGQIPVDDNGNIVGASTKGIPVEQYVKEHCTTEFQESYTKNGLNIPLYDVKYQLHLWVWTTTAGYVNDFMVEYTLNDQDEASAAGTVEMVIDWLADKNGSVNASNGHQLGTSSYITKLYSKSIAKHRCDYKEQRKGEKTVKKEETTKVFGYKRPKK